MDGPTLSRALATQAKTNTGSGPVPGLGRIGWLAGALSAEEKGFAADLRLKGDELEVTPFTPELASHVPADVSLFIDVKGLDATLDEAKRTPSLQKQLGEAQKALGALIDEIIGLFKGETAITVRPVGGKNEFTLLVAVDDAEKAKGTLDKLATLVGAFTQKTPEPVNVAGQDFQKLSLGKSVVYYGILDGKLVVTNAEGAITEPRERPLPRRFAGVQGHRRGGRPARPDHRGRLRRRAEARAAARHAREEQARAASRSRPR